MVSFPIRKLSQSIYLSSVLFGSSYSCIFFKYLVLYQCRTCIYDFRVLGILYSLDLIQFLEGLGLSLFLSNECLSYYYCLYFIFISCSIKLTIVGSGQVPSQIMKFWIVTYPLIKMLNLGLQRTHFAMKIRNIFTLFSIFEVKNRVEVVFANGILQMRYF